MNGQEVFSILKPATPINKCYLGLSQYFSMLAATPEVSVIIYIWLMIKVDVRFMYSMHYSNYYVSKANQIFNTYYNSLYRK